MDEASDNSVEDKGQNLRRSRRNDTYLITRLVDNLSHRETIKETQK